MLVGILVVSLISMTSRAMNYADLAAHSVDTFWAMERLFTLLVKVCTP